MNLKEPIELRDRLRLELAAVEKYIEIARRYDGKPESDLPKPPAPPSSNDPKQPHLPMGGKKTTKKYGEAGDALREALKLCPHRYTVRDIRKALSDLQTPLSEGSLTSAMRRFVKRGDMKLLTKSKGRRPAKFIKQEDESMKQQNGQTHL